MISSFSYCILCKHFCFVYTIISLFLLLFVQTNNVYESSYWILCEVETR